MICLILLSKSWWMSYVSIFMTFQDYMADHDQQYLIELDGNQPVNNLFKVLIV